MTLPAAVGADANLIATGLPASSGVTFQLYFNGSTTPTVPTNTPAQVGTTSRWQVTLTAGERDNESVAVVLSGATIVGTSRDYVNQSKQGAVEANVATWLGAPPDALVSGKVQSDVGSWQGFTIPGPAMIEDDGSGNGRFTEKALERAPAGSGGGIIFRDVWRWATDTSATDPTSGRIKANSATLASITEIYISDTTQDGANRTGAIESISSGDKIQLSRSGAQTNYILATATAAPIDNGSWYTLAVTAEESGGSFSNNNDIITEFIYLASGSLTQQDVANSFNLIPGGSPAAGSVNHVLPLGNAPTSGPLLTGGQGANQINTNTGAADANVVAWQDDSLVAGTKMIQDGGTVPKWTAAALQNGPVADVSNLDVAVSTRSSHSAGDIWSVSLSEPSSRPSWVSMTYGALFGWLGLLGLNKQNTTASQLAVRNDADSADVATSAQSDDGTTYSRGPWV